MLIDFRQPESNIDILRREVATFVLRASDVLEREAMKRNSRPRNVRIGIMRITADLYKLWRWEQGEQLSPLTNLSATDTPDALKSVAADMYALAARVYAANAQQPNHELYATG